MTKEKEYVVGKIRKIVGRKFKALLGMGDSGNTVAVEGKADYVWIRLKFGSALAPPVEALSRHVPPIHGRLVTVQEREAAGQKGFEVIDWDQGVIYYHDDTTYEDLPAHGWTHESGPGEGSDPVNLYTRGWAELRVEPTVPCSMQGYVTYGWYLFDIPTWFTGGNTPVITAPTVGQRYDLVYLDSSGTVGIETGVPGAPDFITIPEPPDYTIPLAAIYMTGTSGCITDDMILDCRVMPNVKSPILFDDSLQPSAIQAGDICWPGSASAPARRDHRHSFSYLDSHELKVRIVGANYTAGDDNVILVDAQGGAVTVGFPTAVDIDGRAYHVKKIDESANIVTVNPFGTELIDGDLSKEIEEQYSNLYAVAYDVTGTVGWWIL